VPIVGSIVSALYDANKDLLLGKLENATVGLSSGDLESVERIVNQMSSNLSNKVDEFSQQIEDVESTILDQLASVEKTILKAIDSTHDENVRQVLQDQLQQLEQTRSAWLGGISRNQQFILSLCPKSKQEAIARRKLFTLARENEHDLQLARDEEMNFRLHELRWLGLIARERHDNEWHYWLTENGIKIVLADERKNTV